MNTKKIFALLALCVASRLAAAAPTIAWNQSYLSTFYPSAGWYQGPQAIGQDADGNLTNVLVWVDGNPFAFNNGGNGSYSASDPNWAYHSSGVHLYKAQAYDSDGNTSEPIYWIVKINGSSISYYDLPTGGAGQRIFPNIGEGVKNNELINDVISSLNNDHALDKVLEFPAGNYRFETGQLDAFTNVANMTIQGDSVGTSNLVWGHANLDDDVHSFFVTDPQCATITFTNLTMDTPYTTRHADGSHIKIMGSSHVDVLHSVFRHAPGYALLVERRPGDPLPTSIHIDYNVIEDCYSDGIHIRQATDLWMSLNEIKRTGDDGIALINDYDVSALSTNFHIGYNSIKNTGWRGIVVLSGTGTSTVRSEVSYNDISDTASTGIEIDQDISSTYLEYINVYQNDISGSGNYPKHNTGLYQGSRDGMILRGVRNMDSVTANLISGPDRHCVYLFGSVGSGVVIGNTDLFSPGSGNPVQNDSGTPVTLVNY